MPTDIDRQTDRQTRACRWADCNISAGVRMKY